MSLVNSGLKTKQPARRQIPRFASSLGNEVKLAHDYGHAKRREAKEIFFRRRGADIYVELIKKISRQLPVQACA